MGNYTKQIVTRLQRLCEGISSQFFRVLFGYSQDHGEYLRNFMSRRGLFRVNPFGDTSVATYCIFPYRDRIVRQCIWELKFQNRIPHALPIGAVVYDVLVDLLGELESIYQFTDPVICFVPSHSKTVRERGYQVNDLIIRSALKSGLDPWVTYHPATIRKTQDTIRQSRITQRSLRLQNPKGSFQIKNPALVARRNIILLDDVMTTGATIGECTRILQHSGAQRIVRIIIAH